VLANVIYFNESRLTPHKADLGLCVGSNAETANDDEHDTGPSEKMTFELDSAVGKAGSFEGTSPHYFLCARPDFIAAKWDFFLVDY